MNNKYFGVYSKADAEFIKKMTNEHYYVFFNKDCTKFSFNKTDKVILAYRMLNKLKEMLSAEELNIIQNKIVLH